MWNYDFSGMYDRCSHCNIMEMDTWSRDEENGGLYLLNGQWFCGVCYDLMDEAMQRAEEDEINQRRVYSGVFISYRRSASQAVAIKIYKALNKHSANISYDSRYEREFAFIDLSIRASRIWTIELNRELAQREIFIFIISEGTFDRVWDEEDVLRKELLTALDSGKKIIPVQIDNAPLPQKEDLPENIRGLLRFQCLQMSSRCTNREITKLIDIILNP